MKLGALGALFVLTLRQHLRGRRLLVLSLLFLLPSALAALVQLVAKYPPPPEQPEFFFIFNFIPHSLAPLTALLYAAGIIQDEVEGQTLTYLLLRPLPRWAMYLTKLAATIIVTTAITAIFTLLAYAVIYWNSGEMIEVLKNRAPKTLALMALAQVGYCCFFGALGLFMRRSLVTGLAYIVVFEGLLANMDFVVRKLTVMYYFRILALRWLDLPSGREWSLDLAKAPSANECVTTLLIVSALFTLAGAVMMMRQEFRMKTPGGN